MCGLKWRSMFFLVCLCGLWVGLTCAGVERSPHAVLVIHGAPPSADGIVLSVPVNFTEAAKVLSIKARVNPKQVFSALEEAGGWLKSLLCQFDPSEGFDPQLNAAGTLSLRLPPEVAGEQRVRVYFTGDRPSIANPDSVGALNVRSENGRIVISNEHYSITHDPKKMGGLPSRIQFRKTGKVFSGFSLNDRVHDPKLGSFHLRNDPDPKLKIVAQGPVRAVVQIRVRYMSSDGKQPDSRPEAIYEFAYYAGSPVVRVEGSISQREPFRWSELHFIEVNFPDESFPEWAAGEPLRTGKFEANKKSFWASEWGALVHGESVLGLFGAGAIILYDGRGEYGTYLHGPWISWAAQDHRFSAFLWIGSSSDAARAVQRARGLVPAEAFFTVPSLLERMTNLRKRIAKMPKGSRRGRFVWVMQMIERMHRQGQLVKANDLTARLLKASEEGEDPKKAVPWFTEVSSSSRFQVALQTPAEAGYYKHPPKRDTTNYKRLIDNGRIGMGFEVGDNGTKMVSFFDLLAERELLADEPAPIFTITVRDAKRLENRLDSAQGWRRFSLRAQTVRKEGARLLLRWEEPLERSLSNMAARCQVEMEGRRSSWRLSVENDSKDWSLWRVVFPQVALGRIGDSAQDDNLAFPRGAGELVTAPLLKPFSFAGLYPNGWASFQFMTHYDVDVGFYFGVHDPLGSTKEIRVERDSEGRAMKMSFDFPAENMGVAGNDFRMPGQAVLQTFHGDWFDAAQIYKRWVQKEAKWYPEPGKSGRSDTPKWMQELPLWALTGGGAKEVVEPVKAFAKYMGIPVAVHWYSWHQIPFDNDYPHYFPTKEGFADGVRDLQKAGVFVMPYINGRLWDTRDRGMDDFEFSRIGLPGATKDESGNPYIEIYGSKETDGSPVRLAPMCPTTRVWQEKVQDIVLRLFNECGVNGVYIDQVAAAPPTLCMDKTHGHPVGGGHWWTVDGYWKMLSELRSKMRKQYPDRMLTTECNAEPYVKWFDGYLTWHWQFNGQIPIFPAVYGGKIQLFSRAYRGGATKDLALRMKAGQQLVFGEQLGWIDPNIVKEENNAAFLRRAARMRWALRDYFCKGEMARPPKLVGSIPKVTADWQWAGEWIVTTDALLSGAWRLPPGKVALIFVNVSEQPLRAELVFDGEEYGFKREAKLKVLPRTEEGVGQPALKSPSFRRMVSVPPRQIVVLEMHTVI